MTISINGGYVFDINAIDIYNLSTDATGTFSLTTSKTSTPLTGNVPLWNNNNAHATASPNGADYVGISSFTISQHQTGGTVLTMSIANLVLSNITAAHTANFNANGGTGTMAAQVAGSSTSLSANSFSNPGYSFAGWSTSPGGSFDYADTATYSFAADITLYAKWSANPTHTVAYANGGGTGTAPTQAAVSEGASFTVAANTFTRAGYTFSGWNDGSNTYAANSTYTMGTSNVTLTAQWTATSQSVTYAAGGGTGTPPTQANVATGGAFTVASGSSLTRSGYNFTGWNDGSNNYAASSTYTMGASNVTLTAQWTATTQSVTYAAGCGTGTPPTQANVATGGTFTVASGSSLARSGYTFNGWSDGSSNYAASSTYTMGASNVTLTAQWTATSQSVTYAAGGGTGTPPTQANVTTGGTFTVASGSALTRSGYTFNGWNDGSNNYAASSTYTMGASNVTLTAQWTASTQSVTYAAGGGTGTPPTQANVATGGTFTVASGSALTRSGYNFTGWNDGSNNYAASSTYTMGASNVTLTAQWTATTQSVTYAAGGGTGTPPTQANVATGGTFTVASGSALTRSGYTFNGWNDGSNNYAASSTYTMGASNVTLTAQWTATSQSVTYAAGGGTGTPPTQADVTTGGTFTVASGSSLTRSGYTFNGWNDGSNNYAASSTYTMGASNVTLTAQWAAITYTVTYNGNGNTGGTVPTDGNNPYNNGATVTVLGNTGSLTQTNFAFAGWNTAPNGSGTSYSAAATFTIGANTTLYAQWTAAVNGACGTAVGSSFSIAPSGAALCLTGSPSAVTSASGQYSWTCGGSGGGTSSGLCVASWAGTGVGPVTGSVSSQAPANNNNWVLNSASFTNTLPAPAPAGATFPQGIVSLQLTTGAAGSNASVTINYTQAVPAGSVYMKYGKSPDGYSCSGAACLQDHWYQMPANQAVFAPDLKSVTLTIQDGGVGDNDLLSNSSITDPGGPALPAGTGTSSVPTLGQWAMLMLVSLIALIGLWFVRKGEREAEEAAAAIR